MGLSALLLSSARAYLVVKTAGALYLLWLGPRMVWQARRATTTAAATKTDPGGTAGATGAGGRWFARGLLTNVLNPKVALFYLALLPQSIPPGGSVARWAFLLAGIHLALGAAWLSAYAAMLDAAARPLRSGRVRAWLARVTGAVLVAIGVRLLMERRPAAVYA